ncbi:MAG: dTDP-4-dehydrorhamnose 3,5-epimerase [Legionella sp.]|nr:MAG: dTDP-4-dehydrorhamnose 3,5-epimerase [Legionella sp.]
MKCLPLEIPAVILIEPAFHYDDRGFFFESFNFKEFQEQTGLSPDFVQENYSRSKKNVLRGLHFQKAPRSQGKLIRVIRGEIFDVAVDLRKNSPTFGKWIAIILNARKSQQIWIPPGFAHGFLTLSKEADVIYKTTDFYSPEHEQSIAWNDPIIGIKWPSVEPILSPKDACSQKNLINNIEVSST